MMHGHYGHAVFLSTICKSKYDILVMERITYNLGMTCKKLSIYILN